MCGTRPPGNTHAGSPHKLVLPLFTRVTWAGTVSRLGLGLRRRHQRCSSCRYGRRWPDRSSSALPDSPAPFSARAARPTTSGGCRPSSVRMADRSLRRTGLHSRRRPLDGRHDHGRSRLRRGHALGRRIARRADALRTSGSPLQGPRHRDSRLRFEEASRAVSSRRVHCTRRYRRLRCAEDVGRRRDSRRRADHAFLAIRSHRSGR